MNAKKAKTIRRLCGDDKKSARRLRRSMSCSPTSIAQQPKNLGCGPSVPVGRVGNGEPDAMAPHATPLRAIFQIAKEQKVSARELVRPMVDLAATYAGFRDPIKFLANGPRTRVNAVLRQLQA